MPQQTIPLYERGRQPHVFDRYLELRPIHVHAYRWKRPNQSYRRWVHSCRPIPSDKALHTAVTRGEVNYHTVEIRPRRPHSWRLLYRAVQALQQGDHVRAAKLAHKAVEVAANDFDLAIVSIARGFELDILGGHEDAEVVRQWRSQADWWAGGVWSMSGALGRQLVELAYQVVRRAPDLTADLTGPGQAAEQIR